MTALDFPSNPYPGQTYYNYRWWGDKWAPKHLLFSPEINVPQLLGWWDTSVPTSITLFGSSNVSALADQSGNGNHITQSAGRTLPYSATNFNTSYPGIKTVSGNGFLETPSPFPMGTGNTLTIWYVGTTLTGASTSYGRIMSYSTGGGDYNVVGRWGLTGSNGSATAIELVRNSTSCIRSSISASPAGHRVIYTINSSGLITSYVDGVAGSTATSGGNWATNGYFCIFRHATQDGDFAFMTIAECGVSSAFLDATAVAALDTYLKTKWGLS